MDIIAFSYISYFVRSASMMNLLKGGAENLSLENVQSYQTHKICVIRLITINLYSQHTVILTISHYPYRLGRSEACEFNPRTYST